MSRQPLFDDELYYFDMWAKKKSEEILADKNFGELSKFSLMVDSFYRSREMIRYPESWLFHIGFCIDYSIKSMVEICKNSIVSNHEWSKYAVQWREKEQLLLEELSYLCEYVQLNDGFISLSKNEKEKIPQSWTSVHGDWTEYKKNILPLIW